MPNYGEANYWDERYLKQSSTTFDWLESWTDIQNIIEYNAVDGLFNKEFPADQEAAEKIKENCRTLNLGCGNSVLPEDMYDDGYLNIDNVDISEVCI